MVNARPISTKERVWTFLNNYYAEKGTTPTVRTIKDELRLKQASANGAIKALAAEGYVRVSMHGIQRFIILMRIGRYTG